jgi:uncharacterized protein YbjT (DUF2867 family)
MTILVSGSTGAIGSQVVAGLCGKGVEVRALARSPDKATFPPGVTVVKGDLLDVDSMRAALTGVTTLFLLNAVAPDELNQALITLNVARAMNIKQYVYFSVLHSDLFVEVPHFASKYAVERAVDHLGLSATVLRPAYFMQNDLALKKALVGPGVYPTPVGTVGLSMIDTRDITEIAVLHLIKREKALGAVQRETVNLVGPENLTGVEVARIWSAALARQVQFVGHDLDAFEKTLRGFAPAWLAYDIRLMFDRFQRDGMIASQSDRARLVEELGHPLRSYRAFATESARQWAASEPSRG